MKKNSLLVTFLLVLFIYSCSSKKVITNSSQIIIKNCLISDSIKNKNKIEDLNFQQIRINGKIDIIYQSSIPRLNLTMYIKKNAKIWTDISFLIFFSRSLITPIKIQAYETIKQSYIDTEFSNMNNLLGLDFIDYRSIEKFLLGKLFTSFNFEDYEFIIKNKCYIFKKKELLENEKSCLSKKIDYQKIIFNSDFSLQSIYFHFQNKKQFIFIEYIGKIKNQNIEIPNLIKISIKGNHNKEICIKYTNFDFNEIDTPFRIPQNYIERKF